MSRKVIEFDHVGKQYVLGTIGTGTLSQDLNRWWAMIRGKEDPYLKIGDVNDRTRKGKSKFVWALKDINFDVEQGDVVGIIGKNGAGKSTLLKVLSRVTAPTTGYIKVKGRIASLLEVGTGFHPEMTGRENIYMNGSIMGMTKSEISHKLDEIVDFAGVEKYLDTPVKRYSSGMIVRLGFSIAAHLEPEILVVDEVLAVGDAEFQKKAIGKMQDVSNGEGRTVLFVSHNMAAVKSLCKKGIVLQNGQVAFQGNINDSLQFYLNNGIQEEEGRITDHITFQKSTIKITEIIINGTTNYSSTVHSGQDTLSIKIEGVSSEDLHVDLMAFFKTLDHIPMATLAEGHYKGLITHFPPGNFTIEKTIQLPKYISCGDYYISLCLHHPMVEGLMDAVDCALIHFEGYQEGFGRALRLKDEGFMGFETI